MKTDWYRPLIRTLLLCLLCAAPARAQLVGTWLGVGATTHDTLHLSAGLSIRNALLVGGYGIDARLLTDIGHGSRVEFDALVTLPLSGVLEDLTLYAGPGAALDFAAPVRLRPDLTLGGTYSLNSQIGLFSEAVWTPTGGVRVRAGLTDAF